MLNSLCSASSSLQHCGQDLDPRYPPVSHFQHRLLSHVAQLQICTHEAARIETELAGVGYDGKRKWDRNARGSWERGKWALVGDHKMKTVKKERWIRITLSL